MADAGRSYRLIGPLERNTRNRVLKHDAGDPLDFDPLVIILRVVDPHPLGVALGFFPRGIGQFVDRIGDLGVVRGPADRSNVLAGRIRPQLALNNRTGGGNASIGWHDMSPRPVLVPSPKWRLASSTH